MVRLKANMAVRLVTAAALLLSSATARVLDPLPDTRDRELPGWQGEIKRGFNSSTPSAQTDNAMSISFISWMNPYMCARRLKCFTANSLRILERCSFPVSRHRNFRRGSWRCEARMAR